MDGQQLAGAGSQASPLAVGLSGSTFFSNLMSSVTSDNQNCGLNLIDIPLTLSAFNGYQPNITFATTDDLLVSSINLPINSLSDAGLYRMSDGSYLNSSDTMLKKESKSPINIIVTTDGIQIQGPVSPIITSQANQSGLQFQSVVRGGDKMLSAVSSLNFNDSEMLGDSAFDSTSSSGLAQFDDGLLSSLGSAGQGMRLGDGTSGTSFDLFDGEVTDNLSLSPQPFSDTGLMPDTTGVMDTGLIQQQTDSLLDSTLKLTAKNSSATIHSPDLSGQNKCGPSQCPLCGKTFSNINALSKHRLTHSDERKYVCNICSKGFKRQDHLNGHLMTHLDKKPYECQLPNCDKGYCDARSLRRHLEQHHHLDPETVQTHVQASMAAAGISPPAPRTGSKKSGDGRSKHLSSPVYSPGSATPTPSPGAAGAGNVFHFDAQQIKNNQQQKQPHEILVQQIHQQQKLLLQQQKQQQQQQQEEKAKEHSLQASDAVSQHLQLQLHLQQQQQQQQQSPQQTDVLAVIQQVQQQLDVQKKKAAAAAEMESSAAAAMAQESSLSWQDKAGVYTFVGTPTSCEHSPASRSDQSPGGIHGPAEMTARSPVSPATSQPVSPLTNPTTRAIWYSSSPDTSVTAKIDDIPKNQAYCTTCDRYFKNASALNGHMRCHGGFLKKGKEKDGKKSPVRKSSSDMGPPLRRPPHTSTPSPQPTISRMSPTMSSPIAFVPAALVPMTTSQTDQNSAVEVLNVAPSSDHHLQNFLMKTDVTLVNSALPQQKHKHLQEQLSSHILKRRMSGELQQRQQKTMQASQQQQQQMQSSQEQMRLLEEHIKQQHQQQQQQMQDHSQQNLQQLLSGHLLDEGSNVPVTLDSVSGRAASPHQGEHIQRLVQSFQQVEEFQRQQQHQAELPQLSAEQLELIRQQHKLLGLPPLNPQQLQYQLHEEHNRLLQAQLREQHLQEHHHHLQGLDHGTLVMASGPLTQQQLGNAQITPTLSVSSQPMSLSGQQTLVQLTSQPGDDVHSRSSLHSQVALNTSVQQILAALDPAVVSVAGINLADHQHLLAQLQKQQAQQLHQSDIMGMQIQSSLTGLGIGGQAATLIAGQVPGLHVSHLPQILLQPPDPDEINGVPTISIPDSVVLGGSSSSVLHSGLLDTEQEQIERIQNGLMASAEKQQHHQHHHTITAALSHPSMAHSLASAPMGALSLDQAIPNFLNIHQSAVGQLQPSLESQSSYGQLRDSSAQDSTSSIQQLQQQQQQQQESHSFLSVMSSNPSSVSSSSAASAAAKNTDAAVAQILKNISNSMAESSGLLADNSDMITSRGIFGNASLDTQTERTHVYQSFQGYPSSFSKSFKDSIKQDVMLSSTVDSDMNHLSAYHSDPLIRDEVPYSLKPGRVHADGQNNKRRLSADLESHRTSSSFLSYKPHSGINPHSMLVSPLEVEGLIPGRTRVRSKSGDINYKYVRSKSVDHSPMRPRSFTEDSLFRCNNRLDGTFIKGGKVSTPEQDLFSRSDGAGVFRNPGSLPTSLKIKRKHRPAPLYIPPQFGIFQSRLRSPRVIVREGHFSTERGRGHTPPPYTPPPMLSPFRSGSGLFCTLQSTQPQTPRSAPVTGRVLLNHRGSFGSGKLDLSFNLNPDETRDDDVPETDTTAHINVGADYQAVLPELRARSWLEASDVVDKRAQLWDPSSQRDNTDSQMQCFQDFSCSAAVRGNGCNVEYALHLLHLAKGDISEAMLMLMADPPMLPVGHPMLDYKYQESDSWNSNEMERFYRSIMIHDKDFFKVSKDVGTKSVKQCVQFYYVWKKVCPDDYRRLRLGRGKQSDYNTRRSAVKAAAAASSEKVSQAPVVSESQVLLSSVVAAVEGVEENVESVDSDNTSLLSDNDETNMAPDSVQSSAPNTASSTPTRVESPTPLPPPQFTCAFEGCSVTCSSKQSLKRHQRKHLDKPPSNPSMPRKPRPTTPSRSPVYDQFGEEVFPCRICGRVFAKVKSRSAHMKSHKIAEQAQQEKKAAEMVIASQAFANV
ncbi:hypothetical protein BsWGS_15263 [Bradybaena similaris]